MGGIQNNVSELSKKTPDVSNVKSNFPEFIKIEDSLG
jgi:hypothetical protein